MDNKGKFFTNSSHLLLSLLYQNSIVFGFFEGSLLNFMMKRNCLDAFINTSQQSRQYLIFSVQKFLVVSI